MTTENPIQDTIYAMRFSSKPEFRSFSETIRQCSIVPNTNPEFLLGMKTIDNKRTLFVNLEKFNSYSLKERFELLANECKQLLTAN